MVLTPAYLRAEVDSSDAVNVIGGDVKINGENAVSTSSKIFTLKSGQHGGVVRARDQIFYLDPEAEAQFYKTDNGLIGQVVIKTGGVLSLFGPDQGQNTVIKTPNAVGAIRGTTTYFAWQQERSQTYVCCCYGGLDLTYGSGDTVALRTDYHQAVVLPIDGEIAPAPYPGPINHYDNDIAMLEKIAGRQPRWKLPHGRHNYIAPRPVPIR